MEIHYQKYLLNKNNIHDNDMGKMYNHIVMEHKIVDFENKKYIVGKSQFIVKNHVYFVLDYNFLHLLNYHWHESSGYIRRSCSNNGIKKDLLMHAYIMQTTSNHITADHINRIKTDNRLINLRLSNQTEQNHNQSNRERNCKIPNLDIDPNLLPRNIHVCYDKSRIKFEISIQGVPTNNSYFKFINDYDYNMIKRDTIDKMELYTTYDEKIPINVKLAQALYILKFLYDFHPDLRYLINLYSDEQSVALRKSYNEILKLSNFADINNYLVTVEDDSKINLFNILKLTHEEHKLAKDMAISAYFKNGKNHYSALPDEIMYINYILPAGCSTTSDQVLINLHPNLPVSTSINKKKRPYVIYKSQSHKNVQYITKIKQILNKYTELNNGNNYVYKYFLTKLERVMNMIENDTIKNVYKQYYKYLMQ